VEICDGQDNDCDGDADNDDSDIPDADGDGEGSCTDCDDADPLNFNGNTEVCDGQDNDCDSLVDCDDGDVPDVDADGSCECDDCDDNDPLNFPGNPEVCDGQDNDCDGLSDNNAVDGDYYADDVDGDGFGDPGTTDWQCDGVQNEWDCDDADPTEPVVTDAVNGVGGAAGTIGDPLDTVQDAIDQSLMCVVAMAGTYNESIDFTGKDIVVTGVEGAETTIIDASGTNMPVAVFESGETSAALLTGFTLTGGEGYLSQTTYSWACTSIDTCTDYHDTYCGGGVYADASSPTLEDLIIELNVLPVTSVTPSGNDTYYVHSYGGGICFMSSTSTVEDVDLFENFADQGGGVYMDEFSVIDISETWFIANTATDGAGVQVDGGILTETNVASTYNVAAGDGGGMLVIDGAVGQINILNGEDDAITGGGIYLSGTSTGTAMNSIYYGADTAAGVEVDAGSSFSSYTYNNAYGNAGGEYVGMTDPTGTNGNISADPAFTSVSLDGNPYNDDWTLAGGSPSIDAGDPNAAYNDADGTPNDQGAFGGPGSEWNN